MECQTTVRCPEHPGAQVIEDYRSGDRICRVCGLVIGDRIIDNGGEWRTFNSERAGLDQSRVGGRDNPYLNGCDLATVIKGPGQPSTFGKAGKRKGFGRALSQDQILMDATNLIEKFVEESHLPKEVQIDACNMFKDIHDKKIWISHSKNSVAQACLYIACKQKKFPRTMKEIGGKKELGKCIRRVEKILPTSSNVTTPADFIPRYCSNLKLPKSVEDAAIHISNAAFDWDVVPGKSPYTVASSSVYLASQASKHPKSCAEIAEAIGISATTIRQCYKLMYPVVENLFPENFEFHRPIDELPLQ